MKSKISYMFLGLAMMLTGTSCGDSWLDLEPSTSTLTDSSINYMSDIAFTINGIYDIMQDAYAYSGRFIYYGDVTGDDMQARSATKRSGDYYTFSYTKDTAPTSFFEYGYAMIALCNQILEEIDDIDAEGEDELKDYYKGQAYALRALFLFDLTKIYGYPYLKNSGSSLGVPIVTELLDKDAQPARNTVAECYTQIISDLKNAITCMDNSEGQAYTKGHINLWGAMNLLSRVYLYHGDDQLAYDTAVECIEGAEDEGYALWTTDEYVDAWSYDYSASAMGEVLFEIVNTTDDSPGKESLGRLHNVDGYSDIIVTSSFYSLMTEDPDDIRTELILISSKRGYLYKYQPQEGEDIMDANIPVMRLSETYLNAAEAAMKLGDTTNAATYLEAIVSRANPDNSVDTSSLTLDDIMTERRKELVGEGHRMFDALRDGGYVDRYDVTISALKSTSHLSMSDDRMYFNWDFFRCVLPIPKDEMDANPNMVQNPSYDSSSD